LLTSLCWQVFFGNFLQVFYRFLQVFLTSFLQVLKKKIDIFLQVFFHKYFWQVFFDKLFFTSFFASIFRERERKRERKKERERERERCEEKRGDDVVLRSVWCTDLLYSVISPCFLFKNILEFLPSRRYITWWHAVNIF